MAVAYPSRSQLIEEAVATAAVQDKTACDFCHGVTYDDAVGHCAGCGAPRSQANHRETIQILHAPDHWGPQDVANFEMRWVQQMTAGSCAVRFLSVNETRQIMGMHPLPQDGDVRYR